MSEPTETTAPAAATQMTAQPSADAVAVTQTAIPAQVVTQAPKPGDVGTPEWLNPRLEQAKRSARTELLKEIGVDDPAAAKRALDAEKARADAEKTASELLASEKKAREKAEKDAETYRSALSVRADAEFSKLTPEQQAFVEKQSGGDPAKRLATIEDVRALVLSATPASQPAASGSTAAAQAAPAAPPPAAPPAPAPPPPERRPLPAPASTAAGGASPSGHAPPPVDHLAVLDRLDRTNPIAAGRYFEKHRAEINSLRAQKTAASASN